MSKHKKRLIGTIMPVDRISKGGAAEKQKTYNRINNLHRWWASLPTTVSRITAYAALIDPPISKHKQIILDMCDYDTTTRPGLTSVRDAARRHIAEEWDYTPKVLDPFGGTGALSFAAAWLGCKSYSMDYNPVSVLIQKCVLEYPSLYGSTLSDDVSGWAKYVGKLLRERTAKYYPNRGDNHYAYIWCRTIPCICGYTIPLMHSYRLSGRRKIYFRPVAKDGDITFTIHGDQYAKYGNGPPAGQVTGKRAICVACGRPYNNIETRDVIQSGRGSEMMCIAASISEKRSGRQYRLVDDKDHELYDQCALDLELHRTAYRARYGVDPVPDLTIPMPDGREYRPGGPYWVMLRVVTFGYTRWSHLFNDRQLLCMVILLEILREVEPDIMAKHGSKRGAAIITYLALIMDKTLEKYCRLAPWETNEVVRHCFGVQALNNVWDYAESTPYGIWDTTIRSILMGLTTALSIGDNITDVRRASATKLPYDSETFDMVCTDPPYYDSMQYSRTADFFYVWLKRSVGHLYPNMFQGTFTPKKYEVVETKGVVRESSPESVVRDKDGYQALMEKSLCEMHRVLKHDGILVLVYAHKTTAGWEALIDAILNAGFTITAAWPIDTQATSRMKARGTASLDSAIYVVGRKWKRKRVAEWRVVQRELRKHMHEKLGVLLDAGIQGSDFYIAAIGSALEVFGKYKEVRKTDGTKIMVARILDEIRNLCSDFVVKRLTDNRAGKTDPITKLYISWRWTYGSQKVNYDDARKMFTGVGLDMDDFTGGIVERQGKVVSLLTHGQRGEIRHTRDHIDVIHQALRYWHADRGDDMNDLLRETGNLDSDGFNSVCTAIIEAGRTGRGQSDESRELEQFLDGRRGDIPRAATGTLYDHR